jgi:hypothetical protein
MKKLIYLILLLLFASLGAKAQNTVTLESGTAPFTPQFRYKAVTPDSLNHWWMFNPLTSKYNRVYTATEANQRFALIGSGAVYTNGYGLNLSGFQFSVDTANITSKTYFNTRIGTATTALIATKGTVTSVGATGSNGVIVGGSSPITGSGTFTFQSDSSVVVNKTYFNGKIGTGVATALAGKQDGTAAAATFKRKDDTTAATGYVRNWQVKNIAILNNLTGTAENKYVNVTSVNGETSVTTDGYFMHTAGGVSYATGLLAGSQIAFGKSSFSNAFAFMGANNHIAWLSSANLTGNVRLYLPDLDGKTLATIDGGQTASNLTASAVTNIGNLTGDITSVNRVTTLATVNPNVGSYGSSTSVANFTVNGKGQITGAGNTAIQITESQVTNLVTDLASKLTNPMTTLGDVIYGGASGVPTRLAGNTGNERKFLTSTGSGGSATAPTYFDLFNNGNDWASVQSFKQSWIRTPTSPTALSSTTLDNNLITARNEDVLSNGFVYSVELINFTPDRTFSGANNWTGTNWTTSSGFYVHTPGSTAAATLLNANLYSSSIKIGQQYVVRVTYKSTVSGNVTVGLGGTNVSVANTNSSGVSITNSVLVTAGANNADLTFNPASASDISITGISVKEVLPQFNVTNDNSLSINTNAPFLLDNANPNIVQVNKSTYGVGTISVTASSGTVAFTGVNPTLLFNIGDVIYANGEVHTITATTTFTVTTDVWTSTYSGVYKIAPSTPFAITKKGIVNINNGTFNITGSQSAPSWTTNGLQLSVIGSTLTNVNATGTVAVQTANSIGRPTFAGLNAHTITAAATLYIASSPAAGTNTTITNAYALYSASGFNYFGSGAFMGQTARTPGFSETLQTTGGTLADYSALVNTAYTLGSGPRIDFWHGNPSGTATLTRMQAYLGASNESNLVWYGYSGGGYGNLMWLTGGGSLRVGQAAQTISGDGSGLAFQAQGGTPGSPSYAASFTFGGGGIPAGVALGGNNGGSGIGIMKAYNATSGVILPLQIDATNTNFTGTVELKNYTVAGLPAAGTKGRMAYVTDALAPSFLVTVVGGGTIGTIVSDNGTNWVAQ